MQNLDENSITDAVLLRLAGAPPRLKEVLSALVHHLHDFARETRLTEAEWARAIEFLTHTGQISGPERQEFILLSDVLGLSMLVTAQNHRKPPDCTEATVFGPFHVEDSPHLAQGADIANGAPGQPCFVTVSIRGRQHESVAGATVEVWQSDAHGKYDVQYPGLEQHRARATLSSDAQGHLAFKSVLAEPYPIPHDGPVGALLEASGRHPWRPAHLHFRITAEGYERLVTHVFREDGPYLDSDVVFGVRSSLIAPWIEHRAGPTPDGNHSDVPFYTLAFDFVLNPTGASH